MAVKGNLEIERRWVLAKMPEIQLPQGERIEQAYIKTRPVELRVRHIALLRHDVYLIGAKSSGTTVRVEWEKPIPRDIFRQLWEASDIRIAKLRFKVADEIGALELNVLRSIYPYNGTESGRLSVDSRILAEHEFASEEAASAYVLPDWAVKVGAFEVTDDPRVNSAMLAAYGWPADF